MKIKIELTKRYLRKKGACENGLDWFIEQKETNFFKLARRAKKRKEGRWETLSFLAWGIVFKLSKKDLLRYCEYIEKKGLDRINYSDQIKRNLHCDNMKVARISFLKLIDDLENPIKILNYGIKMLKGKV